MEDFLSKQNALHGRIARSFTNFKKEAAAKMTVGACQVRMANLDHCWDVFNEHHNAMLDRKDVDFKHSYFTDDVFGQAEETYLNWKAPHFGGTWEAARGEAIRYGRTQVAEEKVREPGWPHFCEVMAKVKDEEVKELLCSWKGQRGDKYSVEKTSLLHVVHSAIILHHGMGATTEDTVKGRIQNWLKQAGRQRIQSSVGEDEN
ncbi:hypothetical protein J437_LFUL011967 [Ladona fulva]|uniref:Uncharacterized protein n=1 Tax=Ladona fulva TaxID=123851 RepID=A0A8K0KDA0_LADFU|nr:hypothetical protein J437_LFUL011967 [Ladona fulva]